jgi:ADP-ribose pyrophosphatase YjhB (NUDIX family)
MGHLKDGQWLFCSLAGRLSPVTVEFNMHQTKIQKTYLSVYAPIQQDGRHLLAYNSRGPYTGTWGLTGGGIEFGETPDEAIRRELWEEAGASVHTATLQSVHSHRTEYVRQVGITVDFHHIALLYTVSLAHPLPETVLSPDPSERVAWFTLTEFAQAPLNPFAQLLLDSLTDASRPFQER